MTHAKRKTRHTRPVETAEFVGFARRILAAMGTRIAGHADHLADLAALSTDIDAQLVRAVGAARAEGYSWADIGAQLGCTRQAAQQRFAAKVYALCLDVPMAEAQA
jgi:hypothetical protein